MSLAGKCILGLLFTLVPILAGGVYSPWIMKKKYISFANVCLLLLQTWLYGLVTMFAAMQLIAVPLIANRMPFSMLVYIWSAAVAILAAAGTASYAALLVRAFKDRKNQELSKIRDRMAKNQNGEAGTTLRHDMKYSVWVCLLGAVLIVLVLFQARIASKYQHTDDDDARFVALELIAVEDDQMLTLNPIDGYPMYWNTGEVKKDYTSPWTMYVATCSRITGIHPAALSHRLLPMFLIPLCYLALFLLGFHLFREDIEKTLIFMVIVAVANMFGYTSTHTTASLMLLRIWQGKAVFAGFMLPILLDLLYQLYEAFESIFNRVLLLIACTASSLLSGGGIVISIIAVGVYGISAFIKHRSIKNTIYTWLTCTPCIVYALCNVFWYQVFKIS